MLRQSPLLVKSVDETEELIGLCVRALVAQMGDVPGVEMHMTRNCILGLTGEPSADFNMLTLGHNPDAEGFLTQSVGRARARGLPLLGMMSPHVVETLAPVAIGLGMTQVGTAPLMVLRAGVTIQRGQPLKVSRALGPALVGAAGDLVAAAFSSPRDVIARCIDVVVTETAGVETYLGSGDDGPICTVSVTPTGNTAGISLMATAPEHQRQGAGRALLSHVIEDYRARGVVRFYLTATEAGLPLYASLGFETIAELSAWILEP
ncbi:MAG: GNAT family N-acetyltransferase [Phenylobacterium sp.]|uniref:GNAT family N-acetyltransferase n=1 Tax=Phenylobacterium sp. TaxID=1871053 RepID=UPI0027335E67|nr:GNAT family N-acetyltransferase [Phenylobacterium sp.]MDP3749045.1 GNAT family N-acetyltransferase [Phenylobacterium sp.]